MAPTRKPNTLKTRKPELEPAPPKRPEPGGREPKTPRSTRPEPKRHGTPQPLLPGPWPANALAFLLVTVATLALYAGDLHLGFFNVDDPSYVINNPWIRGLSLQNLGHILSAPYFANYSPLHLLSYSLDYALAGLDAAAFHLASNVWAGVVAGFVFLVALALTRRRPVALAAAALFVVHPAHVEAIAWISSRKDLVAAAFALPSLLAYLRYRQSGTAAAGWYAASLFLFLLAVCGKLSVATFPAVFLALDLFVEKRPLGRSLTDKVPFLAAAGLVAMMAAGAQPPTGRHSDASVLCRALLHSLWLLAGFGNYVIYRIPPDPAVGMALRLAAAAFLLAAFAAPLLLRRRSPMGVVLLYWILVTFIPAQVLSFTHPVADRYLFFPSVAAVILIAWGVIAAGERLGRRGYAGAGMLLVVVGLLWGRTTLTYLAEWRDPRSVWYAAAQKSADPEVGYNLGSYYLNSADRLGTTPRGRPLRGAEARRLAAVVWAGDRRLPALLAEWSKGRRAGPVEKAFQDHLWTLAWDNFERALARKGGRLMPYLYYNRGLLRRDRGDLQGARQEFLAALAEASRLSFADVREQMTVGSHAELGMIAWKAGEYREAVHWFRLAEQEQTRFGGHWVPDITARRQHVEAIVARLPGGSAAPPVSADPEVYYELGSHYLDAADRLGVTPRGTPLPQAEARRLASEVWARDQRLPVLLHEWAGGRRGGPAEKAFQDHLRTLAWEAFERGLRAKGSRAMPDLYYHRGVVLVDRGNLQGARQEFRAALGEASHAASAERREEVMVSSCNALGIIAWRRGDYREALHWLRLAEQEQARSGGRWDPDLAAKRQRLEAIVAKLPGREAGRSSQ